MMEKSFSVDWSENPLVNKNKVNSVFFCIAYHQLISDLIMNRDFFVSGGAMGLGYEFSK